MKKIVTILLLLLSLYSYKTNAQTDSSHLRISVLTCSPGNELYSTFGHSAIRVIDSLNHMDIVFNYGTFDFSDPDFYKKFVRGKMNYFVGIESFRDFMALYKYENRGVIEQVLSLTQEEKITLFNALKINSQEEHKYYKYDFLFDNCTTRIRDLLYKYVNGFSVTTPLNPPNTTFRNMLHYYLDRGGQWWSKLGIDILLGSKLEKPVTINESMFLPDYLMRGIDSVRRPDNSTVVQEKKEILAAPLSSSVYTTFIPLLIFSIVAVVMLALSILKYTWTKAITKIFDAFLLYLTGLLGIFLLFMWFGTDHVVCSSNYNLLWALPTNFIAGFFVWKRPGWIKKYFLLASLIQLLILLCWQILPQQLNIALIPIIIWSGFRMFQLSRAKN